VRMKMSLDEIRSEVLKMEAKLQELKQEKHTLFSQLKKVLNEDVMRRRNRDLQWSSTSDAIFSQEMPQNPQLMPSFAPFSGSAPFFPSNGHQIRSQFKPQFQQKVAPPVVPQNVRKRSHETARGQSPPNTYKSVTYTPNMSKVDAAAFPPTNQSAYYGMMTSSQRKYF